MKYKDENGNWIPVHVKAIDSLPIGTILDYDGEEIPDGYEEITDLNNYSTEEKVIGTYLGKPLYQKTIIVEGHPDSIPHGVSNLKVMPKVTGTIYRTESVVVNCPFPHVSGGDIGWQCDVDYVGKDTLSMSYGEHIKEQITGMELTLEYTKTTD